MNKRVLATILRPRLTVSDCNAVAPLQAFTFVPSAPPGRIQHDPACSFLQPRRMPPHRPTESFRREPVSMYNRCILIHRNDDAMSWRLFFFVLATSTLIAWPTSATPPATQVLMDSGSPYYVPAAVTVTAGGAIRWENPTPTHHTVTHDACLEESGRCAFDSGAVEPGGAYTIPSLPPGRYPYQCRIHPIMRGMIIVTESPLLPSQT